MRQPTTEQQAIIDAARGTGSIMIRAYAGCGKTSTLEMLAKYLPVVPCLATAFNKKTKLELESRLPKHFDVLTLNGMGHSAWGRALGKRLGVKENKLGDIAKATLKKLGLDDTTGEEFGTLLSLVRRARTQGLVPSEWCKPHVRRVVPDDDAGWERVADSLYIDLSDNQVYAARSILSESIRLSYLGEIDYDDQIYMSALFGGVFGKYPIVLVDEAQDLSPLNHIQISKTILPTSRLIVVGDPRQAIYAFRGADSSSMDSLRELRPSWTDLGLSLTFRCPRSVVARQQAHAPGFTAHESNLDGEVHTWEAKDNWSIADVEQLAPQASIAILCRNNAPLLSAALRIIKGGRGCTILGREVGKALISLAGKIFKTQEGTPDEAIALIARWADHEIALARANEKEERVALINDKADCLIAVAESLEADVTNAPSRIRALLTTLFSSDSLRITLSTGHKAKGLEWPIVVHLDPFRVPSKYARSALEMGNPVPYEQDMNLKYVIETRAKHHLVLANFEQMKP